jgi:hypothetical protein
VDELENDLVTHTRITQGLMKALGATFDIHRIQQGQQDKVWQRRLFVSENTSRPQFRTSMALIKTESVSSEGMSLSADIKLVTTIDLRSIYFQLETQDESQNGTKHELQDRLSYRLSMFVNPVEAQISSLFTFSVIGTDRKFVEGLRSALEVRLAANATEHDVRYGLWSITEGRSD